MRKAFWQVKKFSQYSKRIFGRHDDERNDHQHKKILQNLPALDSAPVKKVCIFSTTSNEFHEMLYTLIAHEISYRGIPCYFLYVNDLINSYFPKLKIHNHEVSNTLYVERRKVSIKGNTKFGDEHKWKIDIENKIIETGGIDFFALIKSNLTALQRRYNIDVSIETTNEMIPELVETCGLLLNYFKLLKKYALEKNIGIRIIGWEPLYIPNSILKMLCDKYSENRDIEFIDVGRGYKHYFGYHFKDCFISVANCTRHKVIDRLVITDEEFNDFNDSELELDELNSSVQKALTKRNTDPSMEKKDEVIDLLKEYRERKKRIFVLFAHLFYDTPIFDHSPSFQDMCEWIVETINFFRESDDVLLLKPHPSEIQPEHPEKKPQETLATYISDEVLSDNIILLHPKMLSLNEISGYITCGLVWRSSVALELGFLRIPSIIAGNPHYRIVNLHYAKSKEHYFYLIENAHLIEISKQQAHDTAKYIYMLENEKLIHVDAIEYDKVKERYFWKRSAVDDCIRRKDANVRKIADMILD
jgi:hypothetical protein